MQYVLCTWDLTLSKHANPSSSLQTQHQQPCISSRQAIAAAAAATTTHMLHHRHANCEYQATKLKLDVGRVS